MQACLLPPPLEQAAPAENQPPRILPQNLVPGPTLRPPVLPAGCPETQPFQASVIDPDGDTIHWRVFVDYWADIDRSPTPDSVQADADNPRPIEFAPDRSAYSDFSPHTVELYIADRPFREGRFDQEGRILTDPDGLVDTFIWSVTLDDNLDPLYCPEP